MGVADREASATIAGARSLSVTVIIAVAGHIVATGSAVRVSRTAPLCRTHPQDIFSESAGVVTCGGVAQVTVPIARWVVCQTVASRWDCAVADGAAVTYACAESIAFTK